MLGSHIACIELLIRNAVEVDTSGEKNTTPLLLSTRHGNHDLCTLLLEARADKEAVDSEGMNALIIASQGRQVLIVQSWLTIGADASRVDKKGWTPLICVSDNGNGDVVNLPLKTGADARAETVRGWTALMMSSSKGYERIVRMLLEKSQVNKAGKQEHTVLTWAAGNGHYGVVEILANKGAHLGLKDEGGSTADEMALEEGD